MHGSFILFRKQGLYFCGLLEISSKATSLSREKTLSRFTTLKTSFSSSLVIFIFLLVNLSNLLTYSKGFLGFSQPCSTEAISFDIRKICIRQTCSKDAYIEDVLAFAGNVCTEDAGTKSTCIKDVYTKDTCTSNGYIKDANIDVTGIAGTYAKRAYTRNAYNDNTCIKNTCIGFAFDKSTCVATICAVERLEIHLQSF